MNDTKDYSVLHDSEEIGWVKFHKIDLFYKGYCVARSSSFLIRSEDLMTIALDLPNDDYQFYHLLRLADKTDLFKVNTEGNVITPISSYFIGLIANHFWQPYKALTG